MFSIPYTILMELRKPSSGFNPTTSTGASRVLAGVGKKSEALILVVADDAEYVSANRVDDVDREQQIKEGERKGESWNSGISRPGASDNERDIVLERVKHRDECFNCILGFSGAMGRRWRGLQMGDGDHDGGGEH